MGSGLSGASVDVGRIMTTVLRTVGVLVSVGDEVAVDVIVGLETGISACVRGIMLSSQTPGPI